QNNQQNENTSSQSSNKQTNMEKQHKIFQLSTQIKPLTQEEQQYREKELDKQFQIQVNQQNQNYLKSLNQLSSRFGNSSQSILPYIGNNKPSDSCQQFLNIKNNTFVTDSIGNTLQVPQNMYQLTNANTIKSEQESGNNQSISYILELNENLIQIQEKRKYN
ncbi:hypothetical protein IMG5_175340, partial [Ichthyophthirius multifiliis]